MYGQLKELKTEIEHMQHLHEKAKLKVQRDFEEWWDQQTAQDKVLNVCCYSSIYLAIYRTQDNN